MKKYIVKRNVETAARMIAQGMYRGEMDVKHAEPIAQREKRDTTMRLIIRKFL